MKERAFVTGAVSLLIAAIVCATRNTDAIFVAVGVAFFGLCVAYAEWCERL